MLPLFTSFQMRAFDQRAIQDFGIPGAVLMENAAVQALNFIEAEFGELELLTVGILCGPGNNGGDGLALARHLYLQGCEVELWLLSEPDKLTGDAKLNYDIARKLDIPVCIPETSDELDFGDYDLVVDAMFGTGMVRPAEGLFAAAIEILNESDMPVLAIDVPTGVNTDTGNDVGKALDVTFTVTFQCGKPGLFLPPGRDRAGEVTIAPISLPLSTEDLFSADYFLPEKDDAAALFPNRPRDTHKGHYGKLLIVAGSRGMSGAARLTASAALRTGVGLVVVAVPECIRAEVTRQPELMTVGLDETESGQLSASAWGKLEPYIKWADAIAAGPGLGTHHETAKLLEKLLSCGLPMVLDADALNLIAESKLLNKIAANSILTPHSGELERLTYRKLPTVSERIEAARKLAGERQITIHVKGSTSVTVSPDGKCYLNTTGNPGLATGGSGDVLTGIIGSLLAQGNPPTQSAWGGAFLHGLSADVAAEVLGEVSLLPSDVVTHLPAALDELAPPTE